MPAKLYFAIVFLFVGCSEKSEPTLFSLLSSDKTGVAFSNDIMETDSFNILSHEFMYNGGGVGVGDFNGDGLFDLYFTGNEVQNHLYLNQGNFEFNDITDIAGVGAPDIWSSGVSILDINNDELPDIYISATFKEDGSQRTNKLFINQGNNNDGIPLFIDKAEQYGLADTSYTTQTYFFDYDLDGDLDAYLLNDKLFRPRSTTDLKLLMSGGEETIDKLLENKGDDTFLDVSAQAGIKLPGFGLGAAIFDVNNDGYLDIYVSNDFISNDILYVNQGDGTFEDEISDYFKHHSFSSMGIDASDLNGDGIAEVMTLDMLPENRERVKRSYAFHKYQFYNLMKETGYTMQYNRNSFHLSNPSTHYSEIGELAGLDATEWSWSVLFADFDNDGLKDVSVTNGYPRDITDMDFTDYNSGMESMMASKSTLLAQIPIIKVHNYIFKNYSGYKFEDKSDDWGFTKPTFSNGAVTVDLDNDGDLDYVVNNINDPAHIYKNNASELQTNNFLRIRLKGDLLNKNAFGAKVSLYYNGQRSAQVLTPQRGYISSVEPVLHFGLGIEKSIDSLVVSWSTDQKTTLKNISANQVLTIEKESHSLSQVERDATKASQLFTVVDIEELDYKHEEIEFYDYRFQGLLPRLHSREGPGIAVGDLNGDQLEDLIIGNGSRNKTHIYLTDDNGRFSKNILDDVILSEDMGLLIFDSDSDGDNDLYIVSGSTEFRNGSGYYQDKFYRNDGKGKMSLEADYLPEFHSSGSSVSSADIDKDGDLDLFVAGRIEPQQYPTATDSYILINENGKYIQYDTLMSNELSNLGLVTQGLWTDYNNDGWIDLIVVGEWMSIKLFENIDGRLKEPIEMPQSSGWWNSITGADLDGDGDIDYVLGNQGLNNKMHPSVDHPVIIYGKDFDKNGSIDPIITEYHDGHYYPVHLKMDLLNQLNFLKKDFNKFEAYASASIDELIPADTLKIATQYQAKSFASAILWNDSNGFRLESLPMEAQFAPVYGTLCLDVDLDGDQDILLVGNRYNTEVFEGQHDALNGVYLKNNGQGVFKNVAFEESGFEVGGDARAMVRYFNANNESLFVSSINNNNLKIHKLNIQGHIIRPADDESKAIITYKDNRKVIKEFYRGSSFLSQSSRNFQVDTSIVDYIELYNTSGEMRLMNF